MNQELRLKLLELKDTDIKIRTQLVESGELFDGYNPEMEKVHKENAGQLKEIISKYGWPGKDLVGEDGTYAAWFILQHDIGEPDLIRSCIPLLEDAAQKGDFPKKYVAMTIDRVRIYEGKHQIYGTHYDWDDNGEMSPVSLEDQGRIDELRTSMDLPPLDENLQRIREETQKEGHKPPIDMGAYRKKAEDWYESAGWR